MFSQFSPVQRGTSAVFAKNAAPTAFFAKNVAYAAFFAKNATCAAFFAKNAAYATFFAKIVVLRRPPALRPAGKTKRTAG